MVGLLEILCLLVFGMMLCGVVAAVIIFAIRSNRAPSYPASVAAMATPAAAPAPQPISADHSSHVEIVARLTQRFCPQCRSPLAADSPEGLCPACLMAGAMGGELAAEPANGMAATTPPSGSRPPLDGVPLAEIGDLQKHFPQLEILELLGRGGMGAVYKARQKNLDRIVALKVIPPDAAKDPTFAERFGREARALARLNHPNIVTVYDFGVIGDLHYLLMEYVDGVNLRQTLRAGRLAPREAVAIVPPICDALQYAHDQGVVHRDIKPENVLLDRSGRVKIADFGLAKLLGKGPDDFTLTRTQQVMGTPRYMAPEQIERPSTVDHRADIYSLGVVIYEMLTGELPIGRFEPPSHKVQLDVRIDEVVLRSLEKDPQRRYQRASEVKTDLASAASWPTLAASAVAPLLSPFAEEGTKARGSDAAYSRPAWNTPAPASKSNVSLAPTGGVPRPTPQRERIRRRVAGPAIGLMIAGVLGLFPCLAMVLLLPVVLLIVPVQTIEQPGSSAPAAGERAYDARVSGAAVLPSHILTIAPPLLLAQDEADPMADMARGPMWATTFAGLLVLLTFPLSLVMIVGGWRMMLLKSYGLAMVAACIALLPCTFSWFLGLPMGIWALVTLLNGDVRDAFDREADGPVPLQVPRAKAAAGQDSSPATGNRWISGFVALAAILVLVTGLGIVVALAIPAFQAAGEKARQMQSMNNLKQIGIALHNYHDTYRSLPPAVVTDADGQPLYSGRVLLLPHLDQQPLYDAFDLTQRWDSPANRHLSRMAVAVFSDPSQTDDSGARCSYQFVTGAGTVFESGQRVSFADCTDGLANIMAMVEVKGSGTSWAEPRELDLSSPQALPAGNHPGGNLVLFGDGSVRFLEKETLTPSKVRALATRNGGERIEVDPAEFTRLLEGLRAETFDPGKLSFVEAISKTDNFTSAQVRQLLGEFDFDSERVDAAVALHPRVVDPENFYLALDAFDQETGFSAVAQKLALYRPAEPLVEAAGDAVSDQELAALVARLKAASLDTGKLAFLKMIVHGRVFTCDQAAELLKQFDFDTDRERAALAIYPRLSDPKNFYRILTVFTFDPGRQSVRKQLKLE